ncbi:MAG: protease inhibitor I42 family protein [Candidatus Parcubacteria bacterium]|nr:protease inhibitor I42 family protein [Candidatus Parcubacteria bacterium]
MVNKLWENRLFMIFSVIIVLTLVTFVVVDLWDWPQVTKTPASTSINNEDYIYTEADSGSIQIPKGQEFVISLESNQTTGFQWAVQLDSNFIEFKGKQYITDEAGEGMVGVGGHEKFTFIASQVGKTEIILTYVRPWESVQPAKTLTYNITITE